MRHYEGNGIRVIYDIVRSKSSLYSAAIKTADIVAEQFRVMQQLSKIPREREAVAVVMLDGQHRSLGFHVVSVGTVNGSMVHPREVFRPAIAINAVAIILAHNHPTGDTRPSADDIGVTTRIKEAGQLLGIELLDHIIVGETDFYSFAQEGTLV